MWDKKALGKMILSIRDKNTLLALVSQQQRPDISKKEGLIILLHGAPGVGKTATVRAIAEALEFPLRIFQPSDVGKGAAEASGKLFTFFETAQRWNAIALIDDADVFLEGRTLSDLERNAIVALFLSSLERYTGTLFLTTNRVGTFDEAFKSRIRLSLYFAHLTKEERKKIWKNHINSLDGGGGGEEDYELLGGLDELAEHELNGRQIGNVFLNAKQLAKHRGTNLSWEDVEYAIKATSNFERYLKDVNGDITDEQWARERELR
jgi:SpoVK/Ycf46/Vps4 family AAA+-type ATPase